MKPLRESCKNKMYLSLWRIGNPKDFREAVRKRSLTHINGERQRLRKYLLSRNIAAI